MTTPRTTPLDAWIAATVGAAGPAPDRAELERYQLARLRETVDLARRRSPFYRRVLAGVPTPEHLADLGRLPTTTPDDLARHGPQLVCVSQDDVARVVTLDTSGTTGAPKRVWFTRADQDRTVDFFGVGMSTFTDPGDRVLILLPGERPGSVGDLLATALERLGAVPIRHGVVQDVDRALAVLHDEDVDVVVGVPVQVLALALADRTPRPKAVLLSTDHVPRAVVRAVEAAWGCRVFGHYGMTEMGLGGGVECEARRGYHLREADLLVEVVAPGTAGPAGPAEPAEPAEEGEEGEEGEVVFTTLTRTGMPLIRYRTGDLSRVLPGPCPCGSALRTLERVTRRLRGVVPVRGGGQLTLADLDEALFGVAAVQDFEAVLARGAAGDRLTLDVRTARPAGSSGGPGGLAVALEEAVGGLPVVRDARARGLLDVTIRVTSGGPPPPAAKRRLRVVGDGA